MEGRLLSNYQDTFIERIEETRYKKSDKCISEISD